jgi:hypothetical protein
MVVYLHKELSTSKYKSKMLLGTITFRVVQRGIVRLVIVGDTDERSDYFTKYQWADLYGMCLWPINQVVYAGETDEQVITKRMDFMPMGPCRTVPPLDSGPSFRI